MTPPWPATPRLLVLGSHTFLEQITEGGGATGRTAAVVLHGLGFFFAVLRLDRQGDGAGFAIYADVLGFDAVTGFDQGARVVDAVARQLGSPQVAFHAFAQVN